jgi:hypothetical protein
VCHRLLHVGRQNTDKDTMSYKAEDSSSLPPTLPCRQLTAGFNCCIMALCHKLTDACAEVRADVSTQRRSAGPADPQNAVHIDLQTHPSIIVCTAAAHLWMSRTSANSLSDKLGDALCRYVLSGIALHSPRMIAYTLSMRHLPT